MSSFPCGFFVVLFATSYIASSIAAPQNSRSSTGTGSQFSSGNQGAFNTGSRSSSGNQGAISTGSRSSSGNQGSDTIGSRSNSQAITFTTSASPLVVQASESPLMVTPNSMSQSSSTPYPGFFGNLLNRAVEVYDTFWYGVQQDLGISG